MKTVHQQPVVTISPMKSWTSAIYEGTITHHRQTPKQHAFTYRLYHLYLDLDEVDGVLSGTRWWRNENAAPASFRQRDYLPGSGTLTARVRDLVQQRLGFRPSGPIRLLTHLRTFGISFNPVSFYYCFSANEELVAIIAEISNIPWLERFSYVLDCRNLPADKLVFNLNKAFHISPFMGMQQNYTWHFSLPEERLAVQMNSFQDNRPLFTASLQHQRHPISASALDGLLWRYPAMPMQVISAIYWQAGRLWWKGVPVHDHPEPSPAPLTPINSHTINNPAAPVFSH
jgi:uncharacterized protein